MAPVKPPRLELANESDIDFARKTNEIDNIESVEHIQELAASTPTSSMTPTSLVTPTKVNDSSSSSKKKFHESNISLVNKEFHDKGIMAIHEMYDTATSASYTTKSRKESHQIFDFKNPLKLSKLNKDRSDEKMQSIENPSYQYIPQSENNHHDFNNSYKGAYSKSSINSNKKFSNEPKPTSSILSSPSSNHSFSRDEQYQRSYTQSEKKLNDFFSKFLFV